MEKKWTLMLVVQLIFSMLTLSACRDLPLNDPYPFDDAESNIFYSAFSERPKHLDPARSYTTSESPFISQIYEPPLQYHYLKRPYVLVPNTAVNLPVIKYFDKNGKQIEEQENEDTDEEQTARIAYSEYWIKIKPGTYYQPHPAFAKNADGTLIYHQLDPKIAKSYKTIEDFKETGTKELIAEDYVYQIKRLAEPSLNSPIFGFMSSYILGLSDLRKELSKNGIQVLEQDLRPFSFEGAEVIDRYTYKIRVKGKYPQFQYWLAMNFFAPVPWEVALFYANKYFQSNNISLDWYPVGTGPYMLIENNPERRMTLVKNPHFRGEFYPSEGSEEDERLGRLALKGVKIPIIDKVIFSREPEDIPRWNKFLQGYYDNSGISSDNFSSAIQFSQGGPEVSDRLKKQGIRLQASFTPAVFYWGFNMLDPVVGGRSESARKLRKAIALSFDVEEFISIFMNGRGITANGPIPPEVYGFETQGAPAANNIQEAKRLLKEAGYQNGLQIYLDAIVSGGPDEIATHAWLKQQFSKLGLNLVIRGSDYNRFQDKVQQGATQMYFYGWEADYPDPENFLFLFYGPNSGAKYHGENSTNYSNPEYDALFEEMKVLSNGPERLEVISEMIKILQKDQPWIWGFFPKSFALQQSWMGESKPSGVTNNNLKYLKVDPKLRAQKIKEWNQALVWPIFAVFFILLLIFVPAYLRYWKQEHQAKEKVN